MSAWDITGAIVWGGLAYIFWTGALTPNKPPAPRFGDTEFRCASLAIGFTGAAAFCIARLCGAHA